MPGVNVFTGGNGAGKTSFLEAIFVLGRGQSFRVGDNRLLIQSDQESAQLTGRAFDPAGGLHVGVRIAPGGLDIRIQGRTGATAADLAAGLPVQAIHADICSLVQGAPEPRRRLLDWGVFHVEHDYLRCWRQFRRTLAQRNLALRQGAKDSMIAAWDASLVSEADRVDQYRQRYIERLRDGFERFARQLLDAPVALRYQRGWAGEEGLAAALQAGREADRAAGYTRQGPHRADFQLEVLGSSSRWRASRGQQKLLGASLVLAQCENVARHLERPVALLVDEPAADLDQERLAELMGAILSVPAQVFLGSISLENLGLPMSGAVFHVEHGEAKALL